MAKKNNFDIQDCISANVEIKFTGEAGVRGGDFAIEIVDDTIHLGTDHFSINALGELIAVLLHVEHRIHTLKKSFDLE
jgi:hypothetical protein